MQLHEVLLGEFYFVSCTSNVMSALYEVLCEVTISVFQGTASVYNMYGLNRCHQYRFCRLHGTRCISAINNVIIEVCRWKRIQYMLIHAWRINSDGLSVLCLKKKKKKCVLTKYSFHCVWCKSCEKRPALAMSVRLKHFG